MKRMNRQREMSQRFVLKEFAFEGYICQHVEENPRDQLLGPYIKRFDNTSDEK